MFWAREERPKWLSNKGTRASDILTGRQYFGVWHRFSDSFTDKTTNRLKHGSTDHLKTLQGGWNRIHFNLFILAFELLSCKGGDAEHRLYTSRAVTTGRTGNLASSLSLSTCKIDSYYLTIYEFVPGDGFDDVLAALQSAVCARDHDAWLEWEHSGLPDFRDGLFQEVSTLDYDLDQAQS